MRAAGCESGPAAPGGVRGRAPACGDADEAYGHPGAVSPAEHVETNAGAQDLPYLLRKLAVTRPNQVWAMDITYVPMARGFVYLAAVVDWFSRKVLAWRLSVTLETQPCLKALKEAITRFGVSEIMNTDQGSQFTSVDFITVLKDADIRISMDGKGAWRDNVFVERLWRTIKYKEVYLRAYDSVTAARQSQRRYINFYNASRPSHAGTIHLHERATSLLAPNFRLKKKKAGINPSE